MEDIGVSTVSRECRIESSKVDEILGTAFSSMPGIQSAFTVHCFGSWYEGTQTEGMNPDIDQVVVFDVPVILHPSDTEGKQCLLMVQDDNTPPGYAKLQPVESDENKSRGDITTNIDMLYEKVIEPSFDKYKRPVIKLKESSVPKYLYDQRQGPAFKTHGKTGLIEQDYVFSFKSKNLPDCIQPWLKRDRHYGWPNKCLLESCKSLGCLFVPIGHRSSDEYQQEWRISFSHQERLRLINFNSVQMKCYILLKMIKKDIIQPRVGCESISSYHLKTCMLYMIETTPHKFWAPDNLMQCVVRSLKLIVLWLKAGNCPNYFLPSENMFDGRISKPIRAKLHDVLDGLLLTECRYFTHIKLDDLGISLEKACTPSLTLTKLNEADQSRHVRQNRRFKIYKADVLSIFRIRNFVLFRNYNNDAEVCSQNIMNTIRRFQTSTSLAGNTIEETHRALRLIIPYLEQALMCNCLALRMKANESDDNLWTYLSSNMWNEISAISDPVTAKLKQATFLHVLGYYTASLHVLSSIDKVKFLSVCYCDSQHAMYPDIDSLTLETPTDQNITLDYHFRNFLTPCVVFLPHEGKTLPTPLRYEMYRSTEESEPLQFGKQWYAWVVVDAEVLLHFLFYLNHKQLNMTSHVQEDIDNMFRVIRQKAVRHLETAYNLLGWMCYGQKMFDKAFGCYMASIDIQPSHNAAKWHFYQYDLEEKYLSFSVEVFNVS